MIYLGTHLSSAGGFAKMGKTALALGCGSFQCFVRNPRGSRARAVNDDDLALLRELLAAEGFGPIVAHAPYIMNPCSKDPGIRDLAEEMMRGDLALMERLPGNYYNFHPGSHVGQGTETGCRLIAEMLSRVLGEDWHTVILLETMAGKGSEVGGAFRELREIMDRTEGGEKLGVCLDTRPPPTTPATGRRSECCGRESDGAGRPHLYCSAPEGRKFFRGLTLKL